MFGDQNKRLLPGSTALNGTLAFRRDIDIARPEADIYPGMELTLTGSPKFEGKKAVVQGDGTIQMVGVPGINRKERRKFKAKERRT